MNEPIRPSTAISVIVADDHAAIRGRICNLLAREDDINVIAQAVDGLEAVELVKVLQPDIILLDIGMPHLDGLKVVTQIQHLPTQVIFVTMHLRASYIRYALKHGVKGYILKSGLEEVIGAVRAISRGKTYYASVIVDKL
ncbi:MAG TPA: response regulator transcription factor [Anaerolineae bacterium]|nr:response regulator transcription factor [Anaerolineae bacterium]MCB0179362.1 response regulator transcription factor [Anaerolineae bacterium]MCB0223905.1 response regulator transcription factor [Anaerolineae bacterium]MCB9105686.1 response regulator transcription factor [Anaerolineales bacterium]HRV93753.1 response regulator transcription factor [Anaerolineae bacterium]